MPISTQAENGNRFIKVIAAYPKKWYSEAMWLRYARLRSENWAGIVSCIGTLALCYYGDISSVYAVFLFLTAEAILFTRGHKSSGYSLACFMFALGDLLLVFSVATSGNTGLQIALIAQTVIWSIGSLRWPIEQLVVRRLAFLPRKLRYVMIQAVPIIQPITGLLNLIQRLPLLLFAFVGGSWILFVAASFWSVADVLSGRLQHYLPSTMQRFITRRSFHSI
jgi:hypothetical protein